MVHNPEGRVGVDIDNPGMIPQKSQSLHPGPCERVNTTSTSATDEGAGIFREGAFSDEGLHEGALLLENLHFSLEQPPFLVEVKPETDGTPLGITVSPDDDASYLTIDDVRTPGLIAKWNASHCEDMTVRTGYTIVSVNGVLNSAHDMLAAIQNLRKGSPLRLLIQAAPENDPDASSLVSRDSLTISSVDGPLPKLLVEMREERQPFVVKVQLGRSTPLGLAVSIDDDPSYVSIDGISSPGLIAEWNLAHDESNKVCVGDIITSVGSSTGSGKQLLHMMTSIQHYNRGAFLHLTIEPRRVKRPMRKSRRD
jgi:hypothetical protein